MSKKLTIKMIIIDPQNSFCYPGIDPSLIIDPNVNDFIRFNNLSLLNPGELFVPGADQDMIRLATFIDRLGNKIDDISVTLDTHHYFDISHPSFWMESGTNNLISPFTIMRVENDKFMGFNVITNEDKEYRVRIGMFKQKAMKYIELLKQNNRYALCIWPPHCLIGTFGVQVYQPLMDSLLNWESHPAMIDYVTKGSNFLTEHYSAVKADVVDPEDPTTDLNIDLIENLDEADILIFAGEAKSHCSKFTAEDIAREFGDDKVKKIVFLEDCMSNVPGFEKEGDAFIEDMRDRGATIVNSTKYLI